MKLHGYFRSSATYRVRIALNLKGGQIEHCAHHLRQGEQSAADYLALNPQGLVLTLELGAGDVITQSLAIIEWLEEIYPEPLLMSDTTRRVSVRAFVLAICCDRLRRLGIGENPVLKWAAGANSEGLTACEAPVAGEIGPFCFGAAPTLADICLVPQLANARRFEVDVDRFRRLLTAETAVMALSTFLDAA